MHESILDLNAVRMLVRIAEARSFTAAAALLGMSQSGLSRAMGRLEDTLGVRLLHRNTRSVALTADGRAFVERCAPLLAGLEDAGRQLAEVPAVPSGHLRLTAPSMFGRVVLLPLLGELMRRHPALSFDTVLSDRVADLVEEGYDAALRIGPVDDLRMIARPLPPLRWVTVAAPAYLARHGTPATPDALAGHDCLAVRNLRSGRLVAWQFVVDGRLEERTPAARLAFDSGDPMVDGALAGLGIAQVMEFAVAGALADGRLQRLLAPYEGRSRPLSLLYPPSRQCSPKLRALVDALAAARW